MRFYSYLFKAVTLFLASIAFSETALAQAASWQWAKTGVGIPAAIVNDAEGNLYITGRIDQHLVLEGDTIPGKGGIFVTKYTPGGDLLWVKRYGSDYSSIHGINLDKYNNIYLAGVFSYSEVIGDDSMQARGRRDILLVKLDPDGDPIWARAAGSDEEDDMYTGLGVDAEGSVYIAGSARGDTMYFGNVKLPAGTSRAVCIAKYDTDGNVAWAKTYDGPWEDGAVGVAADENGNVYTTGFYQGGIKMDSTFLPGAASFVSKHDKHGNLTWVRPMEGFTCIGVAADKAGGVYVTGYFSDTIVFGNTTITPVNGKDAFIAKYDKDGMPQWAKRLGNNTKGRTGEGHFVATDRMNAVYVCGAETGYGFVSKISADGKLEWLKNNIQGAYFVSGVCVNNGREATMVGYHNGISLFDSTLAVLPGDMAVAKLTRFPTSVEQDAMLSNSIHLYPNPAATIITINSAEPYDAITIVDVLGRVVIDQTVTAYQQERVIDVSSLSPGVYVVQLKGRTKAQERFVKE